MSRRSLYVTGTDTGVGKTVASVALVRALRAHGLRVAAMKPVASGCERTPAGWRNEDALTLHAASGIGTYAQVNPYALPEPTAPQLAARAVGVRVDAGVLRAAFDALAAHADVTVVEGAGGWLAPFDDGLEQADVARAFGADIVLVVGVKLGCLNHARLTARAIAVDGLRLRGWIANTVEPGFERFDDYLVLLGDALDAPRLGVLPHGASPALAPSDAARLAARLL